MAGTKVVVVNTKICLFLASVFVLKNLLYLKKIQKRSLVAGCGVVVAVNTIICRFLASVFVMNNLLYL